MIAARKGWNGTWATYGKHSISFDRVSRSHLSGGIQYDHGTPPLGTTPKSPVGSCKCGVIELTHVFRRAVDNQVFFSMCSPARDPKASYQAVGHFTDCDPD